ncbi:hypothetical protein [Kocuria palustris]|uniref:hypothetical protein n=1 Tax=Kocuria palustris TaxID=71999 RepID=UPI0011A4D155|nr:hypothetical protein [Kocuria palustris]
MIEGQPTWVGSGRDAVLAWIHAPEDGTSRGIVVLAPPAGREQVLSLLTVRRLAVLLARRGYTAVRFFWRGTSDSQPLYGDPDLVGRWQDDVRTVISHVRGSRGLPQVPVHAIGYRIGAALLASMSGELGTVVAWEPVGGSAFVRQWTRMRAALASSTPQREGEADLLSLTLTGAQAQSLSGLPAPSPEHTVIVKEKDRRRAKAMYAVEPFDTHLHDDVLDLVMDALPEHEAVQGGPVAAPVREVSWEDEHGARLHERLVDVGPEPRVGIVTWAETSLMSRDEAAGEDPRAEALRWRGPGLIVSGGGPDGRAGGGEWPHAARELAASGFVVLRSDRPVVADSTPVDELQASNSYTLRSAIGLQDMVQWLREHGCAEVHAGLHCASAWAACLGELHGRPVLSDSITLIGHAEWKMDLSWWEGLRLVYDADLPAVERAKARSAYLGIADDSALPDAADTAVADRPSDAPAEGGAEKASPVTALVRIAARRLREHDVRGLKAEIRPEIVRWMRWEMPYPLWLRLNRSGRVIGPESVLEPMAARQPVHVVNGPDDIGRWEQTRADRAVRELAQRGLSISEQRLEHMDHSLLTSESHRLLVASLRSALPVPDAAAPAGGARVS